MFSSILYRNRGQTKNPNTVWIKINLPTCHQQVKIETSYPEDVPQHHLQIIPNTAKRNHNRDSFLFISSKNTFDVRSNKTVTQELLFRANTGRVGGYNAQLHTINSACHFDCHNRLSTKEYRIRNLW